MRTAIRLASHPPVERSVRAQVSELQRARLIGAIIEAIEEDGYPCLTVGRVIASARVSRKTFYDLFANREDGFLAAFEQTTARLRRLAIRAYVEQTDWCSGIRAALRALLLFVDNEPGLARLCLVEALGAGERVLEARAELLAEVAHAIDAGRHAPGCKGAPPPLTAEALVGGALAILHNRLAREEQVPPDELLRALMSTIVLPYLGARAARTELNRPCEPPPRKRRRVEPSTRQGDPLQGLKIRVTYRTVRTLMTIARHPGASNRQVGEGAGITDQGQISKLLARLAGLGLIQNRGDGQPKGASNAWHLTARGLYFERVIRPR